jgi:coenzyme PQQ precursor peptide PqqA
MNCEIVERWVKPDFEVVPVSMECTAYCAALE